MTRPDDATFELSLTEEEWAGQVYDYAKLMGWLCDHRRPGMNRRGQWSTPMQGDPGYPDWTFLRGNRLIFAELKTATGKLSADQKRWLGQLQRAGQEAYCWRPADWPLVQRALNRPRGNWPRETGTVRVGGAL